MKIANIALVFFLTLPAGFVFAQGADAVVSLPDKLPIDTGALENVSNITATAPLAVNLQSMAGKSALPALTATLNSCQSSAATAHTFCLSSNPKIQAASGMIGLLISGAAAMKSTSESCGNYNKALKIAETALTAYNAMCTAAQMSCESSCGAAKAEITTDSAKVKASGAAIVLSQAEVGFIAGDLATLGTTSGAVISKLTTCQGYKMNLAAAGVGLMNVLKQSSLASTCQAQTTQVDCTKDPTNIACKTVSNLDCTKPENSANTTCICMAAPNSPGCAGYTGQNSFGPNGGPSTSGVPIDSTPAGNPSLGGTDAGITPISGSGSSGGAGAGGGSGGGAGGLGSSGTGASKATGADGKKEKGTSTNILSGYDGGGGGGGGSRGGRADSPDSAYKAYLPGGAKDPSRGLASKTFGNGEVTAAGSKSNWEKVSERYLDNKPTLMGP